jgi:hypothetical protein
MFTIQTTPISFTKFQQKVADDGSFTTHVATSMDTIIDWAATAGETGYSHEDYIISQAVSSADAPEDYEFQDHSYKPVAVVDGEIVFKVVFYTA